MPTGLQNGVTSAGGPLFTSTVLAPLPQQDLNLLARVDYNLPHSHTIDARYDMISANDHTAPGVNSSAHRDSDVRNSLQPGLQQVRQPGRHLGGDSESAECSARRIQAV